MEKRSTIIVALMILKCISAEVSQSPNNSSDHKHLKNEHNRLQGEKKQLDHQIEKTDAIECLDWLDRTALNLMNLMGIPESIQQLFFGPELECQNEKDGNLDHLNAKKNLTEVRIQKTQNVLKEAHQQKISQKALEKKLAAKLQYIQHDNNTKIDMQQHLDKKE